LELGNQVAINASVWQRLPEDSASDDNPDIADKVGRAEVAAAWNVDPNHTLALTVRHALRAEGNGSIRLAWLRKIGGAGTRGDRSGLRFHTEIFSGYGDSLMDYNRRRTVLSVGLTLLDW
jgi:phospholipase A1